MPSLSIVIDHYIYTITPEGYTEDDIHGNCNILVSKLESNIVHLGYGFLRNFVTTYNYSHGTIQLSLNPHAPEGVEITTVKSSDF